MAEQSSEMNLGITGTLISWEFQHLAHVSFMTDDARLYPVVTGGGPAWPAKIH
jgi:hypothetical protein